jgi:RHS repeat-associated protein
VTFTAGYRADGLRAFKGSGASATYYLYDGDQIVADLPSGSTTGATAWTWGPTGLIGRGGMGTGGVDYLYDLQGNAIQTVNASTGALTANRTYTVFGQPQQPVADPVGFGGQAGYYTDAETGFVLCTARYYDPTLGRWLTRDPIDYAGGIDVYTFCDNNPEMEWDPLGLDPPDGGHAYEWLHNAIEYGMAADEKCLMQFCIDDVGGGVGIGLFTVGNSAVQLVGGTVDLPNQMMHIGDAEGRLSVTHSGGDAVGSLMDAGMIADLLGVELPRPLANRPANPSVYSCVFETVLDPADWGKPREVHFSRCNEALSNAMAADPAFRAMMEDIIPGVTDQVSSVGGRRIPRDHAWEHCSTSTAGGRSGVMRLVPSHQHTPGSQWWRVIHPDKGARGGYSQWAIPHGAPPN